MVETKVTAAALASAVVPLILFLGTLFGWSIDEVTTTQAVMAVATVVIPVVTFLFGWLKKSKTSSVSESFVHPAPGVKG